jgi:hypothetical protein
MNRKETDRKVFLEKFFILTADSTPVTCSNSVTALNGQMQKAALLLMTFTGHTCQFHCESFSSSYPVNSRRYYSPGIT